LNWKANVVIAFYNSKKAQVITVPKTIVNYALAKFVLSRPPQGTTAHHQSLFQQKIKKGQLRTWP